MSVITVENLTKKFCIVKRGKGAGDAIKSIFNRKFEKKLAVDHISFSVEQGEVVGYIGPNGAGKSTTIKMLSGILVPTSGNVIVNGIVPYQNRVKNAKNIGIVFGQRTQLWWDIPVSDSFNLLKRVYKISNEKFNNKIHEFSEILDIDKFINMPVRQLSLGQRMRADICASLLHDPDILFLDEPTIGLDVISKKNIREFIKEINKKNRTTVILTTHDMPDIKELCSRIMVIDHGVIGYDGDFDTMKATYGTDETIIIEVNETIQNSEFLECLHVENIKNEENKFIINYNNAKINSMNILEMVMKQYKIVNFVVQEPDIDEIVRKLYVGSVRRE